MIFLLLIVAPFVLLLASLFAAKFPFSFLQDHTESLLSADEAGEHRRHSFIKNLKVYIGLIGTAFSVWLWVSPPVGKRSVNEYRINRYSDGTVHSRSIGSEGVMLEQTYFKDGSLAQEMYLQQGKKPEIHCYLADGGRCLGNIDLREGKDFLTCTLLLGQYVKLHGFVSGELRGNETAEDLSLDGRGRGLRP